MPGINDPSNPFPFLPLHPRLAAREYGNSSEAKGVLCVSFRRRHAREQRSPSMENRSPGRAADAEFLRQQSLGKTPVGGSPESLKNLIRDGVEHTSAVCVLVGSETWSRRWVRYEIARAVIDDRGLLAVHLNNIEHQSETPKRSFRS